MQTIQAEDIQAPVGDLLLSGFVSRPAAAAAPAPGVLLLHSWWGLTPFFKQLCSRLAAEGFLVFAPDLNNGKTARTIPEAEAMMEQRDFERTKATAIAAVTWLQSQPGLANPQNLGLVGFSMGASWAMLLSTLAPEVVGSVVLFYGVEGIDFTIPRARFQGHFGETDTWTKVEWSHEMEKDMRAANRAVEFFRYPEAGHWFFEEDRPEAFRKDAAALAWERTVAFLKETTVSQTE